MKVFTHTEVAPLVLTCTAAVEPPTTGSADTECRLFRADPAAVDIAAVLQTLANARVAARAHRGRPRLHGTFIDAACSTSCA